MTATALIAVGLAISIAFALYRYYPATTRAWFLRISRARRAIWAVLLFAFATTLLISGSPIMVFAAAAIFGYAVLYLLIEEPLAPIRRRLGI